jgi:hypothetical protein
MGPAWFQTRLLAGAPGPISGEGDFLEIWRREPDGAWRAAKAIRNTRRLLRGGASDTTPGAADGLAGASPM